MCLIITKKWTLRCSVLSGEDLQPTWQQLKLLQDSSYLQFSDLLWNSMQDQSNIKCCSTGCSVAHVLIAACLWPRSITCRCNWGPGGRDNQLGPKVPLYRSILHMVWPLTEDCAACEVLNSESKGGCNVKSSFGQMKSRISSRPLCLKNGILCFIRCLLTDNIYWVFFLATGGTVVSA